MMAFDVASYTHPGRHEENQDALWAHEGEGRVLACVCDGLGGMGGGAQAAQFCAEALLAGAKALPEDTGPAELAALLGEVHEAFLEEKHRRPALGPARSTAVLALLQNSRLVWANAGDSRLYLFGGMDLRAASEDHSAAYTEYRHGAISYGDIRMADTRSVLTACLGDERPFSAHSGEAELKPGDGVLLCSDGFWQYVLEGEMGIDLCKSRGAEDWLWLMLNRLVARSFLDGDNLSAVCCRSLNATENAMETTQGEEENLGN